MENLLQIKKAEFDLGLKKEYKLFQISDTHMAWADEKSTELDVRDHERAIKGWKPLKYEMARDAKTNGGEDILYTRQRKVFAPFGISYEKTNQASNSPTDIELADGSNWTLVHSGENNAADRSYIDPKAIPIARIISKG